MTRNVLIATVAGFFALTVSIVAPIAIVSHHSTERLQSCVENGGAYVQVAERTTMECQR